MEIYGFPVKVGVLGLRIFCSNIADHWRDGIAFELIFIMLIMNAVLFNSFSSDSECSEISTLCHIRCRYSEPVPPSPLLSECVRG